MPFIVLHANSIGISAGLAGLANAIMLVTSIFLKFYLGTLADRFRAVKGILILVSVPSIDHWFDPRNSTVSTGWL